MRIKNLFANKRNLIYFFALIVSFLIIGAGIYFGVGRFKADTDVARTVILDPSKIWLHDIVVSSNSLILGPYKGAILPPTISGMGKYALMGIANSTEASLIDSGSYGTVWTDFGFNQAVRTPVGTFAMVSVCAVDDAKGFSINTRCIGKTWSESGQTTTGVVFTQSGTPVGRYGLVFINLMTRNNYTPATPLSMWFRYTTKPPNHDPNALTDANTFSSRLAGVTSIQKLVANCSRKRMDIFGLDSAGNSVFVGAVRINYGLRSVKYSDAKNYNLSITKTFLDRNNVLWAGLSSQYDSTYPGINFCFPDSINGSSTTPIGKSVIFGKRYDPVAQNPSSEGGVMGPWVLMWGDPARGLRIHGRNTNYPSAELTPTNGCIRMENAFLEKIYNKVIVNQTWVEVYE